MASASRVTAVIVAFAPPPARFAAVLAAAADQCASVIVVDNGNGEGLHDVTWSELIERVDMRGNSGVAAAQNAGLRRAFERGASHALLLDHDSVAGPGMVASLLEAHDRLLAAGERVASVGANYVDPRRPGVSPFVAVAGWRLARLANDDPAAIVRPSYVVSSGCLIANAAFVAIGPMAEDLFIDYVDIEWGLRAGALGWQSFGVCAAHLDHRLGDEPLRLWGARVPMHSPLRHYYIVRNAVWLIARSSLPGRWKVAEGSRMAMRAVAYALLSNERRRHLGAMCRGVVDGLSGRLGRAALR